MKHLFISCLGLVLFTGAAAAKTLDVSVVGTVNLENSRVSSSLGSIDSPGRLGLGFGALVGLPLHRHLALQPGLLLINRKNSVGSESFSFTRVQIPVLARVTALPIVSFGVGPYIEFPMGDIGYERNGAKADLTYESQGFDSTDFGLVASVGADIGLAPLIDLTFDLRYCLGLKDYDTLAADSRKWGGLLLLAGIKIGF